MCKHAFVTNIRSIILSMKINHTEKNKIKSNT